MMKASRLILLWPLFTGALLSQEPPSSHLGTPAVITERGPHHRVWERQVAHVNAAGRTVTRTSRVVEIGTGLHYWVGDRWAESRDETEIVDGQAVFRQAPIRAAFAANLNSSGAIELVDRTGRRFRSHPLAVLYTDYSSGQSVVVAQVKDCQGAVLPPNQVLYIDALEGALVADFRYTATRAGLEQDLIIRARPPPPEAWGLDPRCTRVELISEFIESPEPEKRSVVVYTEQDPALRNRMIEPELRDEYLDFGGLAMPAGHAFALESEDALFGEGSVPTGKSWEVSEGRRLLIEKVNYAALAPHLEGLPQAALSRPIDPVGRGRPAGRERLLARVLPPRPGSTPGVWREEQWAQAAPRPPAVVIDYSIMDTSQSNVVFKAGETYLVGMTAFLQGTTRIEGGATVKYATNASSPTSVKLIFNGPVECQTSAAHPAVFTASADDGVGEVIEGSTGVPAGYYAYIALQFNTTATAFDLHDIRVRHARYALAQVAGSQVTLSHSQLGHGASAVLTIATPTFTGRNVLIHNFTNAVFQGGITSVCEHATIHQVTSLLTSTNVLPRLTNCLVMAVTNHVVYQGGADVVASQEDTGVFQTVGSGSRYLASTSAYRGEGSMNVSTQVQAGLRTRTTWPPVVLTNLITTDLFLGQQAPRDVAGRDIGYHFDPIDYLCRSVTISNASVLVTNGAVLGIDFDATNYGILLASGAKLVSQGFAQELNQFVRIHAVQEGAAASGAGYAMLADASQPATPPEAHFRFTDFPLLSASDLWLDPEGDSAMRAFWHRDCQFRGGRFSWGGGASDAVVGFTNNLFERVELAIYPTAPSTNTFWNNLFWEGVSTFEASAGSLFFHDNFFATTNLILYGSVTNDYNGYITNVTRLNPNASHDVILTNMPVFLSGPVGSYYYPTNDGMLGTLIDVGSRSASSAGLHHFTTLTNQAKDASMVDIGFHFVAVDANGMPLDTDGDGLFDIIEDADGDGVFESGQGETDWNSYNSLYGIGSGPALEVFTPLR